MDDESSSSWFSRLFKPREKPALLEQKLSREAYEGYWRLLMKARPEVNGSKLILRLPNGTVELEDGVLRVRADNRKTAEKILRNLHHYGGPPSLWPAYGLSYSLRRRKGTAF
ncbi:hypothetical protein [Thermococcus celer]|uniref:Uncharacterized protein n=1 Tax=Thermococcus celer Vu 13 = JCM 8558 TaxID=1293037 RepID=A0A218P3Q2_THECE|nr:hypothetical protein [Thermococcus celer]ASI99558.1 hypothetical protein A3L02_08295 [Thermococcus celer Vu 13 = JCM 8558]